MPPAGRSIRIFLATGEVTGIRHAELVNWTGQAIVCPRNRLDELEGWAVGGAAARRVPDGGPIGRGLSSGEPPTR